MSANTVTVIVLSIIALSFAVWVINQELSFKKAVRKDVKLKTFMEKWLEKRLPKLKKEFLSKFGPYCTEAMNKHSKLLKESLLNNSNAEVKIEINTDVDFRKEADKLYEVFSDPGIIDRVNLTFMENPVYNPHFILIDGQHLLISITDDDGRVQEMISFTRNRKKANQFRGIFYKDWKEQRHYSVKEI